MGMFPGLIRGINITECKTLIFGNIKIGIKRNLRHVGISRDPLEYLNFVIPVIFISAVSFFGVMRDHDKKQYM